MVVPDVLAAPGAVVATSTKPDVVEATVKLRSQLGTCWFYDPSASSEPPAGTSPLRFSPVSGCERWDTAVSRAHALARTDAIPGRREV